MGERMLALRFLWDSRIDSLIAAILIGSFLFYRHLLRLGCWLNWTCEWLILCCLVCYLLKTVARKGLLVLLTALRDAPLVKIDVAWRIATFTARLPGFIYDWRVTDPTGEC